MGIRTIVLITFTIALYFLRRSLRNRAARGILTTFLVIMVLGIAANIIIEPQRKAFMDRAYETSFMVDLPSLRTAIDDFHAAKKRYPADLEELDGYLTGKGPNRGFLKTTEGAVFEYALVSGNGYIVRAYQEYGNRVYVMTSAGKDIRYRLKSEQDDALRSLK